MHKYNLSGYLAIVGQAKQLSIASYIIFIFIHRNAGSFIQMESLLLMNLMDMKNIAVYAVKVDKLCVVTTATIVCVKTVFRG